VRVGILGGVFNPPHIGHLVCAQEAHEQLGLDRVVLMPVGQAPHRSVQGDPGGDVRALMCERAIAGDPRFEVSRVELERTGPSYTLDTLRAMRGQAPDDALVLILGADQAAALPRWHEPEEVLRLALVAVAEREDAGRERVRQAVSSLRGADRVGFFAMPRLDVSSTLIRERARVGRPVRYLVPDGVAETMAERALYRTHAPVGAD
jgi:nicotinate-nucleotide adenylyltransferase